MAYRIGIVGVTGAVGQEILALMAKRNFPVAELRPLASARSAGSKVTYGGREWTVQEAKPEAFEGLDFAIFSAGGSISLALAPEAVKRGCIVIDNSSAYRMYPDVPLVIPEINPEALDHHKGILANPNCSTAIALMGLYPLHRAFGLKRFFASTYQAVSGTGAEAMRELDAQARAWARGETLAPKVYPHTISFNLIPQVDSFLADGYTKEEMKMLNEGRKIMSLPDLKVTRPRGHRRLPRRRALRRPGQPQVPDAPRLRRQGEVRRRSPAQGHPLRQRPFPVGERRPALEGRGAQRHPDRRGAARPRSPRPPLIPPWPGATTARRAMRTFSSPSASWTRPTSPACSRSTRTR